MECTVFNWDAFYHAAWNPLHSMTLHGIHCIHRDAFYHAAWNPLHSVTLHGIHCSQSGSIVPHCRETTAFKTRGQIGVVAAGLRYSHNNARSKPYRQPTAHLMAMPYP